MSSDEIHSMNITCFKYFLKVVRGLILYAAALGSALGQSSYPDRPIKFVIGFGPGSGTDTFGRAAARAMSKALGQPIIVENRPGALSTLASEAVARAKPDGYTVLLAANSGMTIGPAGLIKSVRYDPLVDFEPVGLMLESPYVLLVDPNSTVDSVGELVQLMKSDARRRNCAAGNGSIRVFCELFGRKMGLDIAVVPYRSTADAAVAVMGSQAAMLFLNLDSALPRIRSSQLKPLAFMAQSRSAILPTVPTAAEAGLGGIPMSVGWLAMFVPAKTPHAIVARLNAELNAALNQHEMLRNMEESGSRIRGGTPEVLAEHVKRDLALWKRLIVQRKTEC
jgi:tripartite-type tricarboxylate transporter receptor subunit TctC